MTALFTGLFDDAALFPPGDAPMPVAVPAHARLRAELGDLVGPFVVPAARLDELVTALGDGELTLSVIAAPEASASAAARVGAVPGLTLVGVEVPGVGDGGTAAGLGAVLPVDVPAYVELPRTAARDDVLDALAGLGARAKLRTGGLRTDLFPSPAELADTITACVTRGVPFKCTAGLHAALPHTDPATGFAHHGFLTVLLAADAAANGGDPEAWLREHDRELVVTELHSWAPDRAARARASFTSLGTCSVTEPVDDLRALGLLPERIAA